MLMFIENVDHNYGKYITLLKYFIKQFPIIPASNNDNMFMFGDILTVITVEVFKIRAF